MFDAWDENIVIMLVFWSKMHICTYDRQYFSDDCPPSEIPGAHCSTQSGGARTTPVSNYMMYMMGQKWTIFGQKCLCSSCIQMLGIRAWKFMQTRQIIFNCTDMQVLYFFYTNFRNFWHITCLSPINHCKVINSQKTVHFWPTLYILDAKYTIYFILSI